MILRDTTWNLIRNLFSEEEKAELRKVITGEAICPKGFIIDETRLPKALREKLLEAMAQVKKDGVKR